MGCCYSFISLNSRRLCPSVLLRSALIWFAILFSELQKGGEWMTLRVGNNLPRITKFWCLNNFWHTVYPSLNKLDMDWDNKASNFIDLVEFNAFELSSLDCWRIKHFDSSVMGSIGDSLNPYFSPEKKKKHILRIYS